MNLVRFNPRADMLGMNNRLHRMFDDFFPAMRTLGETENGNWNPSVDIFEEENNIVIKAEIPGVDKENISIDVNDGILTLKGEKSLETEEKEEKYYRREMSYGKFERSFRLPGDVNTENINADYKDGVLKVAIPKPEEPKTKKITVH